MQHLGTQREVFYRARQQTSLIQLQAEKSVRNRMLTSMFLCSVEQQLTNGAAQHFICNSSTPQISLDTSQQQTISSIIQMQPVSAGTQTAESAMVGILIPPHRQGVSSKLCTTCFALFLFACSTPPSPPPSQEMCTTCFILFPTA